MSFILPKGDVTLTDAKNFRNAAVEMGISEALKRGIAANKSELNVRGFENVLDAGAALDQWNTAALATVGTAYSCFQAVAAPILAANKLVVWYKVGVETIPLPVSLLTIRSGGAAGNILAEYDLEQLVNGHETEGYFNEPIVFGPTRQFAIQVLCRIATGVLARVQLGGWIIEPAGQLIASG